MTDFVNLSQHFHDREQDFVKQALDWIEQAQNDYRLVLTKFLNPRQRYIVQTLANQHPALKVAEDGVFTEAQARRLVIAPDFYDVVHDDFHLSLLQLSFPAKFVELYHKDILGAFVHAGLDRSSFGDIVAKPVLGQIQVAVDQSLVSFIQQEIVQIGKVKAKWQVIDGQQAFLPDSDGEEYFLLLPSLRLDAVIAAAFKLSRSKAQDLVENGLVRVNWTVVDQVKWQIAIKDVISVRKYGRISLETLSGHSKKDKIKAVFNIIHR